ncbi:hypothetical protein EG878_14625 [Enterococcus faecalis]|nr:hypothetical protein EG878_14625 [Enterococcus faecalis]
MSGWDIVNQKDKKGGGDYQEVEFLPVPIGLTKFRILDAQPFAYEEYWSNKGNGGKGTSIPVVEGDLLEKENQEYLDRELPKAKKIKDAKKRKEAMKKVYQAQPWKKRQKFAINVIDRSDGKVKVLDKGLAVFREIKKYAMNDEYGDPRQYDMTLERSGEGLGTEYSITPARSNTPLTSDELALEKVDLEKLRDYSNYTAEQVMRVAKGETWDEVREDAEEGKDEELVEEEAVEEVGLDGDSVEDSKDELSEEELNGLTFDEE